MTRSAQAVALSATIFKRAMIIDLVGGAVVTAAVCLGPTLFSAYVGLAGSLAARLSGMK